MENYIDSMVRYIDVNMHLSCTPVYLSSEALSVLYLILRKLQHELKDMESHREYARIVDTLFTRVEEACEDGLRLSDVDDTDISLGSLDSSLKVV